MEASLAGTVMIELTSADIEGMFFTLNDLGIAFRNVMHKDTLTVVLEISQFDLKAMKALVVKRGGSIRVIKEIGLFWRLKLLAKRPLLVVGFILIMIVVGWLPSRILFITVEGNEMIPSRYIIEQANLCGITFGAPRREVRSEKMKNSLLAAIPSLQWAGINTSGCTAVISVKERSQSEPEKIGKKISSIVAVKDGVIESCTSEKGSLLCKVGQAVKKGDVLISGYTDCGIKITATKAEGEVFAQTRHTLTVITPTDYVQKGEQSHVEKKYSMLIGKKRINFYKGSGISGVSCDRINSEYYVTLPGGFRLPIAFFVSATSEYDRSAVTAGAEFAESTADSYGQEYLLTQMISGRILHDASITSRRDGVCVLHGQYICSEMIGREQDEEIIGNYGEDD